MPHVVVPEAEALLDVRFPVLDKGSITLLDYMGGDESILRAARVSYQKGTKRKRTDGELLDHLYRNLHTSPFEQVEIQIHVEMPIFVARQWIRHRTANVNEVSARYSELPDNRYLPELGRVLGQGTTNKQGSEGELPEEVRRQFIEWYGSAGDMQYELYQNALKDGVARELARINLPLNTYTAWVWKIDLHNLFHFLALRLDSHAQYEVRVYAEKLAEFAKAIAPLAYAAFERHRLQGARLSREELDALREVLSSVDPETLVAKHLAGRSQGEVREFIAKFWPSVGG